MVGSDSMADSSTDSNSGVGSQPGSCSSSHSDSGSTVVEHSSLAIFQSAVDNLRQYDLRLYNRYIAAEGLGNFIDNALILLNYSTT